MSESAVSKRNIRKSDIAVIGMACKFPGANDYREFWYNLDNGINSITEIPESRWSVKKYFSPDIAEMNKTMSKWGGLVEGIDKFDNRFFNISPREAKNMDPQQRLLIEEMWHCIEDGGVPMRQLQENKTSVYVGVMASDYHQEAASSDSIIDSYSGLGNYDCILANRISYFFHFTGLSMAVDAACASSLVSIHEARYSLINEESDYAIAAGVNLTCHPWKYISFSKSRMLSPDGQCKAFDKDANGYVPGEGIAVLLLQRLDDAVKEGNHIYAVIRGSAVNHGGKTKSITAPRVEAQQEVILSAYRDAAISPDTLTYVEAHGTGTSLGDPIEVESLTKAFREYIPYTLEIQVFEDEILNRIEDPGEKEFVKELYKKDQRHQVYNLLPSAKGEILEDLREVLRKAGFLCEDNQFCHIGSVKTNIGHLEAAAGGAGIIKVILMLRAKKIPPSLNVNQLNPIINFKESPFTVVRKGTEWKRRRDGLPLRASVSSFGFGGVNSHTIIEEYVEPKKRKKPKKQSYFFLALSAKSPWSLEKLRKRWLEFIRTQEFQEYELLDLSATLLVGRSHLPYRMGTVVTDKEDLAAKLRGELKIYPQKADRPNCLRIGEIDWTRLTNIKDFLERSGYFTIYLEDMRKYLDKEHAEVFFDEIFASNWEKDKIPLYSFILSYAYFKTLQDFGFVPDILSGEKSGVLLGIVLAGMMTPKEAIEILTGQKQWEDIHFVRPVIPYYDASMQNTIMPFHFDAGYLHLLIDEMRSQTKLIGQILVDGILNVQRKPGEGKDPSPNRLGVILVRSGAITQEELDKALEDQRGSADTKLGNILVSRKACSEEQLNKALREQDLVRHFVDEVLRRYVDTARLLNTSQFTFRKYLEEWNLTLKKFGKDITDLLYDDKILEQDEGKLRNEKLLIMVIIMSSLTKLNQKWDLTERRLVEEERFYELVDLVVDGVMPKEAVIELFIGDNPDLQAMAHTLNRRQRNHTYSNAYKYIRTINPNISEVKDKAAWFTRAVSEEDSLNFKEIAYHSPDNICFLQFGTLGKLVERDDCLHTPMYGDFSFFFKNSLLTLWKRGVDIQWEKLFLPLTEQKLNFSQEQAQKSQQPQFQKVVLPSYPFDRKSFWLDKKKDSSPGDSVRSVKPVTVEAKLRQTDNYGLAFSREYTAKDAILRDHIIHGKNIIPGASMIELGFEAAARASRQNVKYLKGVIIHNPGVLKKKLVVDIVIDRKEKHFILKSGSLNLCEGKWEHRAIPAQPPVVDLSDVMNANSAFKKITHLYPELTDKGYNYGHSLQVIGGVWKNENLWVFELNDLAGDEGNVSALSPYMLDGMFQSALSAEFSFDESLEPGYMFLPYYIKEIIQYDNFTDHAFIYIDETDIVKKGNDLSVNLKAYNEGGRLTLEARNMIFRKVDKRLLYTEGRSREFVSDIHYYRPVWEKMSLAKNNVDRSRRVALVVVDDDNRRNALVGQIRDYYQNIFIIQKGLEFRKEGNFFFINPVLEYDYVNTVKEIFLDLEGHYNGCDLYYLWAFDRTDAVKNSADMEESLEGSLQGLFFFLHALGGRRINGNVNILAVTSDAHVVTYGDRAHGFANGLLTGFIKTVALEMTRMKIKTLDFDSSCFSPGEWAAVLSREMKEFDSADVIAYRHNVRYVQDLEPSLLENVVLHRVFKENQVYLIIGGTGGIGLKVANNIASQVKAHIILLGRSPRGEKVERAMGAIDRSRGGGVDYFQLDVTCEEDVKRVLGEIKSQYGNIHGVIHSGGVLEDKYLMTKDWASFRRVIDPKVLGVLNLHNVTKTEPLEFFVVFSSIVSVIGNMGQSDYAAANSFLDAFMHYRAAGGFNGRSISINWTLWSDGGMGNQKQIVESFAKRCGVINGKDGMFAFDHIINSHNNQVVVAGKTITLHEDGKVSEVPGAGKVKKIKKVKKVIQKENTKVEYKLTELLSGIIQVDEADLDSSTDMREYGMDSVGFTEFAEKINMALNASVNPTLFFEYPTIKALAEYFLENYDMGGTTEEEMEVEVYEETYVDSEVLSSIQVPRAASLEKEVEDFLMAVLSRIIQVEVDELEASTDLREYGMDSVSFTDFSEKINAGLAVSTNPTLFFEFPTIEALVGHLTSTYDLTYLVDAAPVSGSATETPASGRSVDLEGKLIALLSEVIQVDEADLETFTDFREYGMDSVGFTEFSEKINAEFNMSINPTVFFEYPTIHTLTVHLEETYGLSGVPAEPGRDEIPLTPAVREDFIKKQLLSVLSGIIQVDADDLDINTDLREYGVDSVGFTEFSENINACLNTAVNPTVFFEFPTITALSGYLMENYDIAAQEETIAREIKRDEGRAFSFSRKDPSVEVKKSFPFLSSPGEEKKDPSFVSYPGNPEPPESRRDSVAIIGINGKFPGADNLDQFWENLVEGKNSVTEIPRDRWRWEDYWGDPKGDEDKINSKWGGFLSDIKRFDAMFFKISPREAELMDPQQRLLLESVWNAVEDAGYKPSSLGGSKTGIYIGAINDDYSELLTRNKVRLDTYAATGSYFAMIPNRISFLLDIHGPSVVVDNACASALVSIHQAVQGIRNGECDLAIAGGINLCITPRRFISFSHAGMLSRTGECKAFDKDADGYVRGEGLGTVVLKPLEKAEADGDHIYGVIRSSAVNHGGFSTSLTAPNPNAQAELLVDAYWKAGIDPSAISYIEAQGTGTSLGDPIEINALKKSFKELYKRWGKDLPDRVHCGIGSFKPNIGHLESASGIAGVIKILLAMKHKTLPATINLKELNPYIQLDGSPFYIVKENRPWEHLKDSEGQEIPYIAGASAFGFGGANAHVVIEEYRGRPERTPVFSDPALILLSARSDERLKAYARSVITYLEKNEEVSLHDLAYTFQTARDYHKERLAVLAESAAELKEALEKFALGKMKVKNLFRGKAGDSGTGIGLLIKGKAGEQFLKAVIEYKELDKMAQLWAGGIDVDWNMLYPGSRPRRISAPGYPFGGDSHWVEKRELAVASYSPGSGRKRLHQLVDSNMSTLREQKFTTLFYGHEFYLADHIVNGQKVLPETAYLEMVRAAGSLAGEREVTRVSDIVWLSPIIVEGLPREVNINFFPENDQVNFMVTSNQFDDQKINHCQGKLSFNAPVPPPPLDLQAIISRCSNRREKSGAYALFKRTGLVYGAGFQGVKEIYYSDTEGVGILELPAKLKNSFSEFVLHPALVDCALQAVLGVVGDWVISSGSIYLPFALDEITIFHRLKEECYVYVDGHDKPGESNIIKYDVFITDNRGTVLVVMRNFSMRAYKPEGKSLGQVRNREKLSDDQVLGLLHRLKTGELDTETADKLIGGYYG